MMDDKALEEKAEAEVERLQGDIAALKNVLRGDESQMKQWQNRNLEMRNDLDRTVLARDEARAEVERLKLKRREQFNRWGVEIRYHDQEQMALRLERAEAEVERLRVEYAAAIERGMRATADLQGQLAGEKRDLAETYQRLVETRAEVARLRAALDRYAQHTHGCNALHGGKCDPVCGRDAILGEDK